MESLHGSQGVQCVLDFAVVCLRLTGSTRTVWELRGEVWERGSRSTLLTRRLRLAPNDIGAWSASGVEDAGAPALSDGDDPGSNGVGDSGGKLDRSRRGGHPDHVAGVNPDGGGVVRGGSRRRWEGVSGRSPGRSPSHEFIVS